MRSILLAGLGLMLAACGQPDPADSQSTTAENPTTGEAISDLPPVGVASDATRKANSAVANRLPLDDQSDVDDSDRGFLARIEDEAILNANGDVVWNIAQFDFLDADAPDTVNPSLWRQSQLSAKHGLYEVTDGVYQVRGYDLAVMSVIEGDTGWIVVDPLTASETAAAALKLVNDTLGERPVSAVLYTHSHGDHFGGVRGVITDEDVANGVPVIAPIGFSESAVAENLIAGNHMQRRVTLMFGSTIDRSITGNVGIGLGPALPQGTLGLILPTEEINGRGTVRIIDGVTFEFIDAAGTEAPAEFMFYLPEKNALCTAEVATATFHNVLTPRGAKVRDALKWSKAIDYVLANYGATSDVVFASHHWPTWGQENVVDFLTGQRDIYRYVHDQTVRRANGGSTMFEIAEAIEEPEFQENAFHTRGYYGTLNHNSKAVFQHYFGWWGGVPADYHALPHEEKASKYVALMGGRDAVMAAGREAYLEGDYRWAAEVLNHLVFADPDNRPAREWLAASYEQMGYQAESGAWRSYYLGAADELRNGPPDIAAVRSGSPDFLKAVPTLQFFDALAVRYDPEKLSGNPFAVQFNFTDTGEAIAVNLGRSVMVPRVGQAEKPAATVTITRDAFTRLIAQQATAQELMRAGEMEIGGNPLKLRAMFGTLETPEFWFNIVEP